MEEQIDIDIVQHNAVEAAKLLKVLSHGTRLLVLCTLGKGDKNVKELANILGLSQAKLSQHLVCLRQQKMVTARREQNMVFYSLADHPAQELLRVLCRGCQQTKSEKGRSRA
jgi:DNA-binding transcriptional ArsR family regulator